MSEFKTAYNLGTYYRTDGTTFQRKYDYRIYNSLTPEELQEIIAEKSKTVQEMKVEAGIFQEVWGESEPFIRITGWETELDEYHLKAAQSLEYT